MLRHLRDHGMESAQCSEQDFACPRLINRVSIESIRSKWIKLGWSDSGESLVSAPEIPRVPIVAQADVRIDGKRVRNVAHHRQHTACFDAYPDAPHLERKGEQPKDYFPAASNGYWLMVEPLTPGLHNISVHALYNNKGAEYGDLEQVFEYQLQVGNDSEKKQPPKQRGRGEGIIVESDSSPDRSARDL